ncbi:hypothetical protein [Deinococcus soli (ex Cha et al. 2016)]|uniref:hypothetical protein n=1 Tax=Deinococcus soli (ex Cha et al. 2016) TaxID=1309411 RepID=UPI0016690B3B|nr:hypothetical protein [Deinococcus soli (ex Cha et al. 2016)]GGB79357.1 hypothetical protein GCM10008019_39470 [Deinococcus soli (ex Cha et al. 2016)]
MSLLHAYALNLLNADERDGSFTVEDSFGPVYVHPTAGGLSVQDGRAGQSTQPRLVRSQRELRGALTPTAPLNTAGLTSGRILTSLGPMAFTVDRLRVEDGQTRLSVRQSGHLTMIGGVMYDELATACAGVRPTRNLPTVVRRVDTGEFGAPTAHVSQLLWSLIFALHPVLVTPRAAWQARLAEAELAAQRADDAVRDATRTAHALHLAVQAIKDEEPHDH